MSNVQITNGSVKYGRTIKTGDFEGKRGDIELSFNIPDGADHDAAVSHVSEKATSHLHELLGHPEDNTDRAKLPKKGKEVKKLPKASEVEELAEEPKKRFAGEGGFKKPAEKTAPVNEIVEDPAPESAEDNLEDLLGGEEETETKEVTDKEMNDAVQACQARTKNGPGIRKLFAEYGVKIPPGRIIDAPQAKRSEIITKLEAIKPLA